MSIPHYKHISYSITIWEPRLEAPGGFVRRERLSPAACRVTHFGTFFRDVQNYFGKDDFSSNVQDVDVTLADDVGVVKYHDG